MIDRKPLLPALALILSPALMTFLPTPATADELEDLDVTMEILEGESELDVLVSQMRGPARSDVDRDLGLEDESSARRENPFEDSEPLTDDGFDHDNIFRNEPLTREDDFESLEGEDLSLDLPPTEEPPEVDGNHP